MPDRTIVKTIQQSGENDKTGQKQRHPSSGCDRQALQHRRRKIDEGPVNGLRVSAVDMRGLSAQYPTSGCVVHIVLPDLIETINRAS